MNVVLNLILVVQLLSALAMIGLILVQHGKGADMGTAFGSGASGSLFGATGGANFLSRTTAVLATVFFVCTLALAYFGFSVRSAPADSGSVLDRAAVTAPAAGASAAAPATAADAIPSGGTPAPATEPSRPATPAAPAASGAGQIPGQ
ncbi:MAG: preprotein translocase subunit SecG [Rubrivivax sp.]|nr:preprotein translocase subunit SecG [Rubrivivax sp.]